VSDSESLTVNEIDPSQFLGHLTNWMQPLISATTPHPNPPCARSWLHETQFSRDAGL
jgi:hypothetical protein